MRGKLAVKYPTTKAWTARKTILLQCPHTNSPRLIFIQFHIELVERSTQIKALSIRGQFPFSVSRVEQGEGEGQGGRGVGCGGRGCCLLGEEGNLPLTKQQHKYFSLEPRLFFFELA